MQNEEQVEGIFAQQLQNLGTDYVDYYLLHILNTKFYNGLDGKGGVVKTCRLFEHAQRWKEEGKENVQSGLNRRAELITCGWWASFYFGGKAVRNMVL